MRFLGWLILFVVAEVLVALAYGGCSEQPAAPAPRVIPAPVEPAPDLFRDARPVRVPDKTYDGDDLVA